jgi:cytochrome b involved in lipid metabolism
MANTIPGMRSGSILTPDDLWLVIDRKVYDVPRWMDEHPGGPEVLLEEAGKDATNAFADIGYSLTPKNC